MASCLHGFLDNQSDCLQPGPSTHGDRRDDALRRRGGDQHPQSPAAPEAPRRLCEVDGSMELKTRRTFQKQACPL